MALYFPINKIYKKIINLIQYLIILTGFLYVFLMKFVNLNFNKVNIF